MELLSTLVGIAGFICWVILLIEAFKDSVLKGIFGLICGFYLVYFGFVESKNEHKVIITIIMAVGCFGWFNIFR